jgi:hypothetical protein
MFADMPPDTTSYMIGGYVVFFSVVAIYLISLIVRWTNLKRDLRTLDELE